MQEAVEINGMQPVDDTSIGEWSAHVRKYAAARLSGDNILCILIVIFGMLVSNVLSASTLTDADTLVVDGISYRLDGIDAPEPEQMCLDEKGVEWQCGVAAREALSGYVGSRVVRCEDKGVDPAYRRRRIGVCRVDGEDLTVNQWIVRKGYSINFEPYAKGRYLADEKLAREGRLGVWAGCFASPRDFRRGNRETAALLGPACGLIDESRIRLALFPMHPTEPSGCPIKATRAWRARVMGWSGIYYVPGCRNYATVKSPERWFCADGDAEAAGFRKAWTC